MYIDICVCVCVCVCVRVRVCIAAWLWKEKAAGEKEDKAPCQTHSNTLRIHQAIGTREEKIEYARIIVYSLDCVSLSECTNRIHILHHYSLSLFYRYLNKCTYFVSDTVT